MTDIMSKEKRSHVMSRIRGRGTGIEKSLRRAMKSAGLSGFAYQPKMWGRPDFASSKDRIAVFCDGDFWHGYAFSRIGAKLPSYWKKKIGSNVTRDRKVRSALRRDGWSVMRFWGHEIEKDVAGCANKIKRVLLEKGRV